MVHEHLWPGIDVPLVDFPNSQALRSAVESDVQVVALTCASAEVLEEGAIHDPDAANRFVTRIRGHSNKRSVSSEGAKRIESSARCPSQHEDGKRRRCRSC